MPPPRPAHRSPARRPRVPTELPEPLLRTLQDQAPNGIPPLRAGDTLDLDPPVPHEWDYLEIQRVVGRGNVDLHRGGRALLSWRMQRRAGLVVRAEAERVAEGGVAQLWLGPLAAPVVVTRVIDEPRRKGFAYATLPGHPEVGEESFLLTLGDDDVVRFRVCAVSRPGTWVTQLLPPLTLRAQRAAAGRYATAMRMLTRERRTD